MKTMKKHFSLFLVILFCMGLYLKIDLVQASDFSITEIDLKGDANVAGDNVLIKWTAYEGDFDAYGIYNFNTKNKMFSDKNELQKVIAYSWLVPNLVSGECYEVKIKITAEKYRDSSKMASDMVAETEEKTFMLDTSKAFLTSDKGVDVIEVKVGETFTLEGSYDRIGAWKPELKGVLSDQLNCEKSWSGETVASSPFYWSCEALKVGNNANSNIYFEVNDKKSSELVVKVISDENDPNDSVTPELISEKGEFVRIQVGESLMLTQKFNTLWNFEPELQGVKSDQLKCERISGGKFKCTGLKGGNDSNSELFFEVDKANNGVKRSNSIVVQVVEKIQNTTISYISDLQLIDGNILQWTAPANVSKYAITYYTGTTDNRNNEFNGCAFNSFNTYACIGESLNITKKEGHLEKFKLKGGGNSYIVKYLDKNGNESENSNVVSSRYPNYEGGIAGDTEIKFSSLPIGTPDVKMFRNQSKENKKHEIEFIWTEQEKSFSSYQMRYFTIPANSKLDLSNLELKVNEEFTNKNLSKNKKNIVDSFGNTEESCGISFSADEDSTNAILLLFKSNNGDVYRSNVLYTKDLKHKDDFLDEFIQDCLDQGKNKLECRNQCKNLDIDSNIKCESSIRNISTQDDDEDSGAGDEPPAGYERKVITVSKLIESPFSDKDIDSLSGQAAANLYDGGIIGGYPDGTFQGYKNVNRAEAAKFLLLAGGFTIDKNAKNNGRFWDVKEGEWYVKYVITAANHGIIKGHPDGSFKPGDFVKKSEFLAMIQRTFDLDKNLPYTYTDEINSDWVKEVAGLGQKYDLFPDSPSILDPAEYLTRDDVAVAIYQYLKNR